MNLRKKPLTQRFGSTATKPVPKKEDPLFAQSGFVSEDAKKYENAVASLGTEPRMGSECGFVNRLP